MTTVVRSEQSRIHLAFSFILSYTESIPLASFSFKLLVRQRASIPRMFLRASLPEKQHHFCLSLKSAER